MHNMFGFAVRNDLILKNPCDGAQIPKTDVKERRVLTKEEQDCFLTFIKKMLIIHAIMRCLWWDLGLGCA